MPHLDKSLIAGLPAFQGSTDENLDWVLARARSARHPKDEAIFEQGEEAKSFFLLLSGHVRVVRTSPEGHQVIARYINDGEWFGVAVVMGQTRYPATAIAAVDCVALSWPNATWPELQQRCPSLGASTFQMIGARLQETQTRVMEISTEQVEQRVAHALLRLAGQSGRKAEHGIEIGFPITRQDIADMTGTTLHTVSRLLSAWESEGIVLSGRQKVTVRDPHGLMLIAENRRPR